MRFVYTFEERIEVVYTSETVEDVSSAEDLTNRRVQFVPAIKTPLALIPKSGGAYHRLSLGETAAVISNPRRVSKDFRSHFIEVFFQSNTFEIEDSEYSLHFGTHRWLECMEQNGYLAHISKVNIFIDTVLCPQKVLHFRRVACALLAMPKLQRLVMNLDIESHCVNLNETAPSRESGVFATEFQAWPEFLPILRMFFWHPLKFEIYIPQMRVMKAWLKKRRELADTEVGKFWCRSDWVDDHAGSANARISNAIADVMARQSDAQEWDPEDYDNVTV
jgi:hypothetical protein